MSAPVAAAAAAPARRSADRAPAVPASTGVELLRRPGAGRPGVAGADDVAAALEAVVDPCSLAQGTPLSLPAMGLVGGWSLDADGVLSVDVRVTAPGCTFLGVFASAAADELAGLPGVREVVVRLDPSVVWSEALLRPDAAAALVGARDRGRAQLARRLPPTPAGRTRE